MKNFRSSSLAVSFVALAVLVLTSFATEAAAGNPTRTITVTGVGDVATRPDTAEIQISVVSISEGAGKALDMASERAKALVKASADNGVAEKDVRTGTVSLAPVYRDGEKTKDGKIGPPVIIGHRATLSSRIVVRDISTVGKLLDSLVDAGANRLSGIRFQVSNQDEMVNKARILAIKDAHALATLMTNEAGTKLGKVLRIEDAGSVVPQARMRDIVSESVGIPVMPGEMEVAAQVRITYSIVDAP